MNTRQWIRCKHSSTRLGRLSSTFFLYFSCVILLTFASSADVRADFWDKATKAVIKKGEDVIDAIEGIGKDKSEPPQEPSPPKGQTESPAPPHYNFDKQKVAKTQDLLNRLGYDAGVVDGVYGGKTRSAIQAFETDRNLPARGDVSAALIARLTQEVAPPAGTAAGPEADPSGASGTETATGISESTACQLAVAKAQAPRPMDTKIDACVCQQTGTGASGWTCSVRWTVPVSGATSDTTGLPSDGGMVAPAPGGQPSSAPVSVIQDAKAQTTVQDGGTSAPAPEQTKAPGSTTSPGLVAQFGLPTSLRRPVIADPHASSEGIITEHQSEALSRFFDLLRLRLNPHLGRYESGEYQTLAANCLANKYLDDRDKAQILAAPGSSSKGHRDWKGAGQNEFETNRATTRYNEEFLPEILSRAPGLPMDFVYVARVHLQPYDLKRGGFPLTGMPQSSGKQGAATGLTLPPPTCFQNESDYLPFATELPTFWPIEPQRAETLVVARIPVDESFPGQRRKVFAAVKFTLSAAPQATFDPNYHQDRGNVPMTIGIESVALYEDPVLERHLHTFGIDNPAPPVLLSGIPESLPQLDRTVLDEETVGLLLLKQQGDVLDREAWEALARRSSRNDEEYYDKKATRIGGGGAHHQTILETYDPEYVPFFPPGLKITHGRRLTDEQLAAFKQWGLKRADLLADRFTLRGQLARDRNSGELRLALGQPDGQRDVPMLVALGYAPGQLVRPDLDERELGDNFDPRFLMGSGKQRVPVLVLANLLKAYQPGISSDRLEKLYGRKSWSYPIEMELRIEQTELVAVDSQREAFLLHAQPLALRALSIDASASLYEQTYQIAALDPGQTSTALLDVTPPSVEKMPFSAEVVDLLITKFLPETVDDAMIARMMLARWHYENSFNGESEEPQWGRFFVEGKPKPDAEQRAELAPRFKEWTQRRADAMSSALMVVFPYARTNEPGPLKLGVGLESNSSALSIQLNSCRSDARSTLRNKPALAQTHEDACTFLENAGTIPGREIYIGTAGSSVQDLFLSRRARKVQPNVSLYGAGIGPRWVCGAAMHGPDPYCRAMLKELGSKGDLVGQASELDDVLVTDKEVYMPDNRPGVMALSSSETIVELDVEVSGVRRVEQLPTHPLIAAYEAYDSFSRQVGLEPQGGNWATRFDEDTVPLFLFDARVKEARVVNGKTHETMAKLELRQPRQPDPGLLKFVEPERVAAPAEPYGPDVVGLRLGMSFGEADRIIRKHMKVGRSLVADRAWQTKAAIGKIDPYTSGRLYESHDGTEMIVIFDEPPASPNIVLGIVRQLNFTKGEVAPAAIYVELEKKYGTPNGPNPSGSGQLWFEETSKENNLPGAYCGPSHNASNLYGIWRDPNAGPDDPAPAAPVYGEDIAAGGPEALQEYFHKQQEYMAALKKRQQDHRRYSRHIPGLDCRGCDDPLRTAECPAGLAATFDVRGSNEWDQLVIQVFDYRNYAQQFSESNRLIEKGQGDVGTRDVDIDVKL